MVFGALFLLKNFIATSKTSQIPTMTGTVLRSDLKSDFTLNGSGDCQDILKIKSELKLLPVQCFL